MDTPHLGNLVDVFIPASRQVHDQDLVFLHFRCQFYDFGHGMGAFQGGNDSFFPGQQVEGFQGFLVGRRGILDATRVMMHGVFGTDRGIIESGGHRVRAADLAVPVLEQVGHGSVKHARHATGKSSGVFAAGQTHSPGFHPYHLNPGILDERVEQADTVAAASYAGHQAMGESAFGGQDLAPRLPADHRLEIADHHRIRMRSQHGPQQVMRGAHVRGPVAHGLADGVLECSTARVHAGDFRPEQAHAEHVERLARHVLRAHVHFRFQPEHGGNGRDRNAVLAGAGFRDNASFLHALREQRLAYGVVDLVRAGMTQVLPLEIDPGSAQRPGELFGEVEGSRPPHVLSQTVAEFFLKIAIPANFRIDLFQFQDRRHEGLGNVLPSIFAEPALLNGNACHGCYFRKRTLRLCSLPVLYVRLPLPHLTSPYKGEGKKAIPF